MLPVAEGTDNQSHRTGIILVRRCSILEFVLFKLRFFLYPYGFMAIALSVLLDVQAARRHRLPSSVAAGVAVILISGYFGYRLVSRQRESLWRLARNPIVEVIGGLELGRARRFDMRVYARFLLEKEADDRLVLLSEEGVEPVTAAGWEVTIVATRSGRAMCCEFRSEGQLIRSNALRFQGLTSVIGDR